MMLLGLKSEAGPCDVLLVAGRDPGAGCAPGRRPSSSAQRCPKFSLLCEAMPRRKGRPTS